MNATNKEATGAVPMPAEAGSDAKSAEAADARRCGLIANEGGVVVQLDEMGLRQLAYPVNKRNTGVYFGLEFQSEAGALIPKL